MLISLRPFRIGDTVEVAGETGVVEQVLVFHTVIKSFSNHEIILPNAKITSAPIINFTALGQRRVEVAVGISYDADIREAREVLLALANAHEKVLEDPAPSVMVNALGDNSVDLTLRAFVKRPTGPAPAATSPRRRIASWARPASASPTRSATCTCASPKA